MKFSLSWLARYLDTEATPAEISARLNALGIEVEGLEDAAERLAGFRVARVLTAGPHPNADKLQVLTVDAGGGAPLQVVCGAPNARAGLIGVLGTPGAVVPAGGFALRKSEIRGVESHGMMCSTRELELGDDHAGIIELPEDAPVGTDFADYHGASPVFEVAVTPNRPDCMGVFGIARDLAAAGLGRLTPPTIVAQPGRFPCPVDIRTEDPEGCPAFFGRVIRGVRNGPSPEWLQALLRDAGQRPISALVDLTNFLMLGFGRPAHVYDLAKLAGAVVARRAAEGEQVLALNGKTYTLDPSMTVIADQAGVHDIAGIMGGEHSSVGDETTDVLLELAWFDPVRIGATGRSLGLASDARSRFERGVDPAFVEPGLELLTALVVELCGGEPSEIVRAGTLPPPPKPLPYRPELAARLGGIEIAEAEQRAILERLGFAVSPEWSVQPPTWRPDVDGPADLVEEVVRVHGIDRVASAALPRSEGVARPTATAEQRLERRLRRAAAARGLNEAITWSFLPLASAEPFASTPGGPEGTLWVLENPISEDMKAMRPSLVPGLLAAAKRNLDRGAAGVRLFEIGRRYLRGEDGRSVERSSLAVVLAGEKRARSWSAGAAAAFDPFDAKAEALALLAEAGAPVDKLQVAGEAGPQFHPGQSATLRLGPKTVLARFGALHPLTLEGFDVSAPTMAIELFLDAIPQRKAGESFARAPYAPPALQSVVRDFAFLVPVELPAGDLLRAVRASDKSAIVAARVFDDFRGAGVPEGRKSVAIEVTFQPDEKSFTDEQLKRLSEAAVGAAAKLGAELRG